MTLPKRWTLASLSDVTFHRSGNSKIIKGTLADQDGPRLFPAFSASGQDVWRDVFEHEGDAIIVSAVGARCGKAFRARGRWSAIANTHIVLAEQSIDTDYLFLMLNDEDFWEKGGTAQPFIKITATLQKSIAIPPLAEQRRIVAKLDALTVRIARARAELVRVPKLVQRIKQHALAICFASAPDRAPIPLGTILNNVQAGKNLRCEERPPHPGELGVVKVSAVTWGRFDPTKAKTLPPDYIPPEAARIRAGDLLMSRANTIELVGAVAMVEDAPRDLFLSDKILRLVVPEDAKRWVQWFLRSPSGREQIERMATGNQLSMRNLSQDALRRIELPFPDAATRLSAVHELEAAFARAEKLQSEAARATKFLDRLEASILAKAFRGELVPQDPADEPASALLDRIRAGRAAAPKARRGRGAIRHAEEQ